MIRSLRTDFGIATISRWVSQRRMTWAMDAVLAEEGVCFLLLVKRVRLDLIHHGLHLLVDEIHDPVGVERESEPPAGQASFMNIFSTTSKG